MTGKENESTGLESVKANFAIVAYGLVSDFEKIKKFIENNTESKLVFQKLSLHRLWIREEVGDR